MTTYVEKNALTLLSGSSDPEGDSITVRRIDGNIVSSWPHSVSLPVGALSVTQSGTVTYNDGGDTSGHPSGGSSAANGSISFTLWDGTDESPTYTASITLDGLVSNTAPSGQNQSLIFEV